jgi:hypothetical protein
VKSRIKWSNYTYGSAYRYKSDIHPKAGFHYVIGADSASGLPNRDRSAYQVLCVETHEQVSVYGEECAPHKFAGELKKAGEFFNDAVIGVELDKYGFLTINILKDIYANLYFHTMPPTSYEASISKEYGWKPTTTNRQIAIDYVKMDFSANGSENQSEKDGALKLYDARTFDEMSFFIKNRETGKEAAQRGKKDDLLAALWIANYIWHEAQIRFEFKGIDNTPKPLSINEEARLLRNESEAIGKGLGPRRLVE